MSSVGTAVETRAVVERRAASKESVASSGETPVVSWMARRRSASVAESGTVTRSRPSLRRRRSRIFQKREEEVRRRRLRVEARRRCIGSWNRWCFFFSLRSSLRFLLLSGLLFSTARNSPAPEPHDHDENRAREREKERRQRGKKSFSLVLFAAVFFFDRRVF